MLFSRLRMLIQMQSKINSLRKRSLTIVALIVAAALVLSLIAFFPVAAGSRTEKAAAVDMVEETTVTNGEFTETSGSETLMTPSSWTSNAVSVINEDNVISGVVDLDPAALDSDALEDLGLEADDVIRTPFGSSSDSNMFAGSDANALFINSDGADIVYGYDSSSISLDASSYYEISAWVKTSDFGDGQGASLKVSGMENDIIIEDIDTVDYCNEKDISPNKENHYGWVEYKIYIAKKYFLHEVCLCSPKKLVDLKNNGWNMHKIMANLHNTAQNNLLSKIKVNPSTKIYRLKASIFPA